MSADLTAARRRIVEAQASAAALVERLDRRRRSAALGARLHHDHLRLGAPGRRGGRPRHRHRRRPGPARRPGGLGQGPVRRRRRGHAPPARRSWPTRPPPTADAPAVARLRAAGAAFIGRTNMTEFAFSGVGINPHHGTPANAATRRSTRRRASRAARPRAARCRWRAARRWAALGSDTGGSIRIPAALHGIVGFKSTARLVPIEGAVPLSTTLDTVCAMTRSVRDAIVAARDPRRTPRGAHQRAAAARAGASRSPNNVVLDGLDATVARAFERSLAALCARPARGSTRSSSRRLDRIAALNAAGGFPAAESWAWHRRWLPSAEARVRPARRAPHRARRRR